MATKRGNVTQEQVNKAKADFKAEQSAKASKEKARKAELSNKAADGSTLTVDELAIIEGETQTARRFPGQPVTASARHRAAAVLHGWLDHAHHAGQPMRMVRDDYLAALAAADTTDERGRAQPHKPAESEYSPHRKG